VLTGHGRSGAVWSAGQFGVKVKILVRSPEKQISRREPHVQNVEHYTDEQETCANRHAAIQLSFLPLVVVDI
jgi:hypothetical protein